MFALSAPAKINWSLYVFGIRPDGYHSILSLVQCVGIEDTLYFEDSLSVTVESDVSIPPELNTVYRAACALKSVTNSKKGVRIILKKAIPTEAGLGGGSSDAATALIGLNRFWKLGLSRTALQEIGSSIGSDVPLFLNRPVSVVRGRGEIVEPLQGTKTFFLLIVKPVESVSTGWAYREYDKVGEYSSGSCNLTNENGASDNIRLISEILQKGSASDLKDMLVNDLETVVCGKYPVIAEIKRQLIGAGAEAALMSGSGSAVFGVFSDKQSAVHAAYRFSDFWCRVVPTLND